MTLLTKQNMKRMKHLFTIMAVALALVACGGNDDDANIDTTDNQAVNELRTLLNGTFVGSKLSSSLTETHEITFTPYSTPQVEEWRNGSISKNVTMYGTCTDVKYYNDHLLQVDKDWKYNIDVPYSGAQPKLVFYPEIYGVTESHEITKIDASSFSLDGVTYTRK